MFLYWMWQSLQVPTMDETRVLVYLTDIYGSRSALNTIPCRAGRIILSDTQINLSLKKVFSTISRWERAIFCHVHRWEFGVRAEKLPQGRWTAIGLATHKTTVMRLDAGHLCHGCSARQFRSPGVGNEEGKGHGDEQESCFFPGEQGYIFWEVMPLSRAAVPNFGSQPK